MTRAVLEKIYAGFLGMNIGIRLGAPVEPTIWSYERIRRTYGEMTGYVKDYVNFAADDDANGPVFFLRALNDKAAGAEMTPQDVAETWLNYAREGVGMFWWGGYGVSTEHTAYLNLKSGIQAPRSGSIAQNGKTIAEQIGGQIFIDTWGLVWPGNATKAAEYAEKAASVSHDGEGVYGARFIAACIALAFEGGDIGGIIGRALALIPQDSTYASVTRAVCEFHQKHPGDWRACRDYLEAEWGYDKYPGVCHIIPNAGVCVMALFYGIGDLSRTIEIATMAGWDTDCNAGNVGTIVGVLNGLPGIPDHYRTPINDSIVLSGVSGSMNILDIPSYAKELFALAEALAGGQPVPDAPDGSIHFDFELPGSTHNFRVSNPFFCRVSHATDKAYAGTGCLQVLFDRMQRGESCRVFYKPFYRREDFSDERYSPVFSPTAYPGQQVSLMLLTERWNGESVCIAPYVRDTSTKQIIRLSERVVKDEAWQEIRFTIPELSGAMADEIGIEIVSNSPVKNRDLGRILIDEFRITGKACYTIAVNKQAKEFGAITPFSMDHGAWGFEDGMISAMCLDLCEAYTGNYFMRDASVRVPVRPLTGDSFLVCVRAQGARRGYYAGLLGNGKLAILRKLQGEFEVLAETAFNWVHTGAVELELSAVGDELTLFVDGERMLQARDGALSFGMCGMAILGMGRALFGDMRIEEK